MKINALQAYIEKNNGFYTEWPNDGSVYSIVDGKVVIDPDNIEQLSKYSIVVVNLSRETWGIGTVDFLIEKFLNLKNLLILFHDPHYHLYQPNVLYFPYFYHLGLELIHRPSTFTMNKKYKLSCFLGASRIHRIKMWFDLCEKSYAKDSLISIWNYPEVGRPDDIKIDNIYHEKWKAVKDTLPRHRDNMLKKNRTWCDIDYPEYQDSYVNLVTETTVLPTLFFSEKTWKPIAAGQLFINFSAPGSLAYLKSIGVDIFDDIIDHNYYDSEPDAVQRLEKIYEILDNLMKQNLEQIYKNTKNRRQQNQDKYFAGQFDSQYLPAVLNYIQYFSNSI